MPSDVFLTEWNIYHPSPVLYTQRDGVRRGYVVGLLLPLTHKTHSIPFTYLFDISVYCVAPHIVHEHFLCVFVCMAYRIGGVGFNCVFCAIIHIYVVYITYLLIEYAYDPSSCHGVVLCFAHGLHIYM